MCGNSLALLSPEMFLHCRNPAGTALSAHRTHTGPDSTHDTGTVHMFDTSEEYDDGAATSFHRSVPGRSYLRTSSSLIPSGVPASRCQVWLHLDVRVSC